MFVLVTYTWHPWSSCGYTRSQTAETPVFVLSNIHVAPMAFSPLDHNKLAINSVGESSVWHTVPDAATISDCRSVPEVSEPVGESSVWRTVPDVCIRAMLEQLWLSCPAFANAVTHARANLNAIRHVILFISRITYSAQRPNSRAAPYRMLVSEPCLNSSGILSWVRQCCSRSWCASNHRRTPAFVLSNIHEAAAVQCASARPRK